MKRVEDYYIRDAKKQNWVDQFAPLRLRPYLKLSRYDRPIGFWLLALPAIAGFLLGKFPVSESTSHLFLYSGLDSFFESFAHRLFSILKNFLPVSGSFFLPFISFLGIFLDFLFHLLLIFIGALAMRGAGCTYNDLIDRKLDAQVERTALRPLAAGTISVQAALVWLVLQLAIGFFILWSLPEPAQIMGGFALPLIAAYPFMKRITWFPQLWLGLTFNWGFLIYYTALAGEIRLEAVLVFAGLAFWTLGYDTIYAHQDKEDDALIGIKSTARYFGKQTKYWLSLFYIISVGLIFSGIFRVFFLLTHSGEWAIFPPLSGQTFLTFIPKEVISLHFIVMLLGIFFLFCFSLTLFYQVFTVNLEEEKSCLSSFKLNALSGIFLNGGLFFLLFFIFLSLTKSNIFFLEAF